ncbi:sensor histidine kinase [Rubritalea spongiae]|uniref:histidine kinase n=1 Tax=Rubritalea spongiae TaxID=430797 RepID=A0ABW5E4E0_9BACT
MLKKLIKYFLLLVFSTGVLELGEASEVKALDVKHWPLVRLEERLKAINLELGELAEMTLRNGVGNYGWQSKARKDPQSDEWVQIEWSAEQPIDQIILIPMLWRDPQEKVQSIGFPSEFDVVIGNGKKTEGTVIASFTEADKVLPRIAPLIIPTEGRSASWIRIQCSKLSLSGIEGKYAMGFSEVMVMRGEENIALHQKVTVSSSQRTIVRTGSPKVSVVDGHTPYLMDAAQGKKSSAYVAFLNKKFSYSLTLDLKETLPVNRIHFHSCDIVETIPRLQHGDYAIPLEMVVEGATDADFSNVAALAKYNRKNIYATGPIIIIPFTETLCRYLRIRIIQPYQAPEASGVMRCVGFTEVELFSKGDNVIRGKSFTENLEKGLRHGKIESLTDGRNHFGNIQPIREWLNQLAMRHDLERMKSLIQTELNQRYDSQKRNHELLKKSLFSFVVVTIIIVAILWYNRKRAIAQTRIRIAANLHDELGANLHAIGMLGNLAREEATNNTKLQDVISRITHLSNQSIAATRYCTNMIEAEHLYQDVVEEMKRLSTRLLADTDSELIFEGEEHLTRLKPRARIGVFLFYKEALTNILRHAKATKIRTHLTASRSQLQLTVEDNGLGVDGGLPASLKRRALLLGGKITSSKLSPNGTHISLTLYY